MPPSHIWTYVADQNKNGISLCPCSPTVYGSKVSPSCVGNDYYCETTPTKEYKWHTDNPMWDGMGCIADEQACCNRTDLPWFTKTVQSTTAPVDAKLCLDEYTANENIGLEVFDLYIK